MTGAALALVALVHVVSADAPPVRLIAHRGGVVDRRHMENILPAINTFHYPADKHKRLAAADIERLKKHRVARFQIDSVYEAFCREP